jgi:hypothetical protein
VREVEYIHLDPAEVAAYIHHPAAGEYNPLRLA